MANHTLALFLRALDNRYQHAQKSEFYARAHVHRFSVVECDAKNDADIQLQQIKDCLRAPEGSRPRALFVNPVRETLLEAVAKEGASLGIGWVSLNRSCDYVTQLRHRYQGIPFLCVDPDQRQAGLLQAQQLRLLLPGGGHALYVHGPLSTSSSRLRRSGFDAGLVGGSIQVVPVGGDWSEESGFRAVKDWISGRTNIPWRSWAISSQNDSMAMGASRALDEVAKQYDEPAATAVPITGCDGLLSYGQRFVGERALAATIIIPPTAGRAIDEVAIA
ncbi:MAG: substrate-binding domain-containing protein, partial [Myxococcota bacterium]|nr:substrate-binding domain-containing protein [Myxococcota bacterium]